MLKPPLIHQDSTPEEEWQLFDPLPADAAQSATATAAETQGLSEAGSSSDTASGSESRSSSGSDSDPATLEAQKTKATSVLDQWRQVKEHNLEIQKRAIGRMKKFVKDPERPKYLLSFFKFMDQASKETGVNPEREKTIQERKQLHQLKSEINEKRKAPTIAITELLQMMDAKFSVDDLKSFGLDSLAELTDIYKEFGGYQQLIKMANEIPKFKNSPACMQDYIYALNRDAESRANSSDPAVLKDVVQQAELVLKEAQKLYQDPIQRRFAIYEIGRAHEIMSKAYKNLGDAQQSKDHLNQAIKDYSEGSLYDIGCRGRHLSLLMQNPDLHGSQHEKEIRQVASDIILYANVTAIEETLEYSPVINALFAAKLIGKDDDVKKLLGILSKVNVHLYKLDELRGKQFFQLVNGKVMPVDPNDPFMQEYLAIVNQKAQPTKPTAVKPANVDEAFMHRTYDYRQTLENYAGGVVRSGNLRFGGELTHQLISNDDVDFFTLLSQEPISNLIPSINDINEFLTNNDKLLAPEVKQYLKSIEQRYSQDPYKRFLTDPKMRLNDINDPEVVIQIIQDIVRWRFSSYLNCIDEPHPDCIVPYRTIDFAMRAINRVLKIEGAVKEAYYSSESSLSALFLAGIGDCRQHASSTQLLFDIWKMNKLRQGIQDKDQKTVDELNSVELRIFDGQAASYIGTGDHTMNILQKKGPLKPDGTQDVTYRLMDTWYCHVAPQDLTLKQEGDGFKFSTKIPDPLDISRTKKVEWTHTAYAGNKGELIRRPNVSLHGSVRLNVKESIKHLKSEGIVRLHDEVKALAKNQEKYERDAFTFQTQSISRTLDMCLKKTVIHMHENRLRKPNPKNAPIVQFLKDFLNDDTSDPNRMNNMLRYRNLICPEHMPQDKREYLYDKWWIHDFSGKLKLRYKSFNEDVRDEFLEQVASSIRVKNPHLVDYLQRIQASKQLDSIVMPAVAHKTVQDKRKLLLKSADSGVSVLKRKESVVDPEAATPSPAPKTPNPRTTK